MAKKTIYNINCGKCGTQAIRYLKIGKGGILRCYLSRILSPDHWADYIDNPQIKKANDIPNLHCSECNEVLGVSDKRPDGRYIFRMRKGYFHKKIEK